MIEPSIHIAFAPRGAGLLCALCWFADQEHVYGWFTGACDHEFPASYFMLEHYYSPDRTKCYLSEDDDVRGQWNVVVDRTTTLIDRPIPVPEATCHQLDRLQDAFAHEWLFYDAEPGHDREANALRARELAVLPVNIRPDRLNKLIVGAPVWAYTSPNADEHVPHFLARHWRLDYAPEVPVGGSAGPTKRFVSSN